jgi:hypothetical protein
MPYLHSPPLGTAAATFNASEFAPWFFTNPIALLKSCHPEVVEGPDAIGCNKKAKNRKQIIF